MPMKLEVKRMETICDVMLRLRAGTEGGGVGGVRKHPTLSYVQASDKLFSLSSVPV